MDMAIAGALSGAGNAGTQALQQIGDVAGKSFIEQERNKWETARLQLHEQYDTQRQQAGFVQDRGLLATRASGEESRLNRKLAADEANLGMQITSSEAMKELDRNSAEGIHARDLALKKELGTEENRLRGEHYKLEAVGRSGGSRDPLREEYVKSVTKPLIENLFKQRELAGPDEKEAIDEKIYQAVSEGRRVLNVEAPNAPAPGQIKDPYRKLLNPAVPGGR